MAENSRLRPQPDSGMSEVVAGLVEDMAVLKQSLMDERWEAVGKNFAQINENLLALHERVASIEQKLR